MDMTMKSLNDAERLDLTRCYEAFDRQSAVSRRSQALLAAAGMDAPARRWFAVTVASGEDTEVAIRLGEARIERWLPEVMVKPRRRKGMVGARPLVSRIAFPGYLFVRVAATHAAWAAISDVKGVTGMLGFDCRPTPITDQAMNAVRVFLEGSAEAQKIVSDAVGEGDRARIQDGPFHDHTGLVIDLDEKGRALLEILLFGRVVPVTVDLAQLRKL